MKKNLNFSHVTSEWSLPDDDYRWYSFVFLIRSSWTGWMMRRLEMKWKYATQSIKYMIKRVHENESNGATFSALTWDTERHRAVFYECE